MGVLGILSEICQTLGHYLALLPLIVTPFSRNLAEIYIQTGQNWIHMKATVFYYTKCYVACLAGIFALFFYHFLKFFIYNYYFL